MTSCAVIDVSTCIQNGSTSYHDYAFLDADGDPITVAEKLEYKLTDGFSTLIDWTEIDPPTAPGTLEIDESFNTFTVGGPDMRYLSFRVTHSGGKVIEQTVIYRLVGA